MSVAELRESRVVRTAAGVLVAVVLVRVFVAVGQWSNRKNAELLAARSEVAADSAALPVDSLRYALRRARSGLGGEFGTLLHGPGVSGAVGAMTSVVNDLAAASQLQVSSTSVDPDTASRTFYMPVRATVTATGTAAQLGAFLGESGRAAVRVRVVRLSISQPDPGADGHAPEALAATVVLEGLTRRPSLTQATPR